LETPSVLKGDALTGQFQTLVTLSSRQLILPETFPAQLADIEFLHLDMISPIIGSTTCNTGLFLNVPSAVMIAGRWIIDVSAGYCTHCFLIQFFHDRKIRGCDSFLLKSFLKRSLSHLQPSVFPSPGKKRCKGNDCINHRSSLDVQEAATRQMKQPIIDKACIHQDRVRPK